MGRAQCQTHQIGSMDFTTSIVVVVGEQTREEANKTYRHIQRIGVSSNIGVVEIGLQRID